MYLTSSVKRYKSTRKIKLCVKDIKDDLCIFSDDKPRLTFKSTEEIVILQVILIGKDKMLVEYMKRKNIYYFKFSYLKAS